MWLQTASPVLWPGRLCTKSDRSAGDQTSGGKGMTPFFGQEKYPKRQRPEELFNFFLA